MGVDANAHLKQFEQAVETSVAVVSLPWRIYEEFINNDRPIYTTYSGQTSIRGRRVALPHDDADRRNIDYLMFGEHGEEIRTAALSLDGVGLRSYGDVWVALDEICINYRAVVLEENAFHFRDRHNIQRSADRPKGYLAVWADRRRLAAVKHAQDIRPEMRRRDFAAVLMPTNQGDRKTDRFIEVEIYGGFNRDAFFGEPQYSERLADPNWGDSQIRRIEDILRTAHEQKKKREQKDD